MAVDELTQQEIAAHRPATIGQRLASIVEEHEVLCLGALLVAVFLYAVAISHHRPFWFDELCTMTVALQPTLHDFWLAMPADANPPLLAFLVRHLSHVFGPTQFAARLPSIIGFDLALLFLYIFVRRRRGPIAGLLAVSIVISQPAWAYAFEARPYAIMLALLMFTLICWQKATSSPNRTPYLIGMAVAIALAMLAHHIALLVIAFTIFGGELVRLYQTRKPDWQLYSPFLVAIPMLAATLPMVHRTRSQLLSFAINRQPTISVHLILDWLRGVKVNLPTLLYYPWLLLLALVVIAVWRWPDIKASIPAHEMAAAVAASLLIPVTMFVMMFSTNYYNCRYAIGCVAGLAIIAASLISIGLPHRKDVSLALIAFFCINFVVDAEARIKAVQIPVSLPAIPQQYADQPVATTDAFAFFPAWWYGTPQQRHQLHFLMDMKSAVYDNNAIPEATLLLEKGRLDANIDQFQDFIATHNRFVAYAPGAGTGKQLPSRLQESGFDVVPIGDPGSNLFEATRPTTAR